MSEYELNPENLKIGLDLMHLLGESLVKDDIGDLGMLAYTHNYPHFYRGELLTAPHPSPIHHWMIGSAMMQISELLSLGMKITEFLKEFNTLNNTVTLLDQTYF